MANESVTLAWPQEQIPDNDILFRRVHRNELRNGMPIPRVFRNDGLGMSTGWNKYSSAEEACQRGRQAADMYGVIEMTVGDVRNIPGQLVYHTPDLVNNNRAHSDVTGDKDEEVRIKFRRIYRFAISI